MTVVNNPVVQNGSNLLIEQIYLECLSQASYVIGDKSTGRAVVVDPRRDIETYLEFAAVNDLTIELILETHFHADFLSGHLELAEKTGAQIGFGQAASPEFAALLFSDGDRIELGEVTLEILETPGHTPESICVLVYDGVKQAPHAVLTGDTLFIGDVGRPDLLSSIGFTSQELGEQLYDSLHNKLMVLPDDVIVYPGHGAGSACGKNLSTALSCDIGTQRATNYALADMSREEFVEIVAADQPPAPNYFVFDAIQNRKDRALADESVTPQSLAGEDLSSLKAVFVDVRSADEFASQHAVGSVNVGLGGRFAEYSGAVFAPEDQLAIIALNEDQAHQAKVRLARIGFDQVAGWLTVQQAIGGLGEKGATRITPAALQTKIAEGVQLVDVRKASETADGFIEGAKLLPLMSLRATHADNLDPHLETVVYCAGGYRSSIAASMLRASGFENVSDLVGGYGAYATELA